MMWTRPMCCIRLKGGLKFIAFIDLLLAVFLLVVSVAAFVLYEDNFQAVVRYFDDPSTYLGLFLNLRNVEVTTIRILLSFCAFYYLQKVALGFILFFAAVKGSKFMLRLWILYTLVLIVLHVLVFLATLCMSFMQPYAIPIYVVGFLFREYSIWCVSSHLQRLTFGLSDEDDDSNDGDDRYSYKL